MTPDGISTEDWDIVHELAVYLVNATAAGESTTCRRRLFEWLDALEFKYGPLPSIVATRADYMDDADPEKEELLLQACAAAESRGDERNVLYIAHSLAVLYLEKRNLMDAAKWLTRLQESLIKVHDSDFAREYIRLHAALARFQISR